MNFDSNDRFSYRDGRLTKSEGGCAVADDFFTVGYYQEMVKLLAGRKMSDDGQTSQVAQTVKRLLVGCELNANRINQERLSKVTMDLCRQIGS